MKRCAEYARHMRLPLLRQETWVAP